MSALPTCRAEMAHAVVKKVLHDHPEAVVLPVVDEDGVVTHLLERSAFLESLAGRFGFSLLNHRPLSASLGLGQACLPLRRCTSASPLDLVADLLRGADGRRVPAVVVENASGRYRGVVTQEDLLDGLLRQSHEQRDELAVTAAQAEQANRTKASFLANMSHELRTPMTAIIGFSEAALELSTDSFQRDFLETVLSAGHHLTALLDDLLDLARIEAGRLAVNQAPFPLRETILATCAMLDPVMRRRGLEFRVTLAEDLPAMACGDPLRLRQVLTNLLSNAAKFTREGQVRVLAGRSGDDSFLVEVSDTGIGIAVADLPRLFRPFSQLAAGERAGGSGLGLAISKHLCDLMGGSLACHSEPGRGSTFSCLLPLATVFAGPLRPAWPQPAGRPELALRHQEAGAIPAA